VLVDAVDQRSVEVEQERRVLPVGHGSIGSCTST
jgi:hypothetical protein